MKPPLLARVCPDGCQGSGESPALTEVDLLHALDALERRVPVVDPVDHVAEEAAWQAARARLWGERQRRERG
jgi:hypothetical protein